VKRAQTAADLITQAIEENIENRAVEKAHQLLVELLPGKMSEDIHAAWVQELIKNGFDGLKRLGISEGIREAEVLTAFALKPAQRTALEEELNKKLGRSIQLKEKVDSTLMLGLRVVLDSLMIDGSLEMKIRESLRHAKSKESG
jgi:F0F1-type ATP synthase delta subunit